LLHKDKFLEVCKNW